ncbi:MAG: tetratricopeptide repeat protein, partial [Polynucleobacter sp.]|nr:tetratricopeptide repeat protein [Polynucleobacter sp.]
MPPKFKNIPRPKAVKKKPASSLTIQFKEALALHQQGKLAEAKNIYLKILAIQPDYFDPLHLLGVIARQNGDAAKAVELISKAIQINPNSPFSYNNLGNAYKDQGKLDQAFSSYDKALALKWDYPEAHYSRADILKKLNKLKEAIAGYDEAIAYKPDYPDAIVDRGNAFMELKQIDAALRDYKKAAELGFGFMLGVWLFFRMSTCDWSDANSQISALVDQVNAGKNVCTAFASLGFIDSLAVQRKTADVWVKTKRPANYSLGPINQYPHHQKIRIAYYSMDFRNHPVAFLTAELFELHDRSRFEIIAFSFGKPSDDPMRQRLKVAFDQFIEVEDKTDLEIAQLSRSMEVDIAIDLAGHTKDSRAGIFACRAAPIQVNYLGYPGTMSAEYID